MLLERSARNGRLAMQEAEDRRLAQRSLEHARFGAIKAELGRVPVEDAQLVLVDERTLIGREAPAVEGVEFWGLRDAHSVMLGRYRQLPERRILDAGGVAHPVDRPRHRWKLAGEDGVRFPGTRPLLPRDRTRATRQVEHLVCHRLFPFTLRSDRLR